jgi:hypothetical protein
LDSSLGALFDGDISFPIQPFSGEKSIVWISIRCNFVMYFQWAAIMCIDMHAAPTLINSLNK